MTKPLKNNNRPYSPEDDALIERMLRDGKTCADIAPLLGRTRRGVRSHLFERMNRPDLEDLIKGQQRASPMPVCHPIEKRTARPEGHRPLPGGHPLTWEIIMRNTPSLAGGA